MNKQNEGMVEEMDQAKKAKVRFVLNLAAILSIYFFSGPGTYENAAIQACMEAWPDAAAASIRSLVTISSVVSVPVMLLVSPFAGKRIRYRTLMLSGAILALAGGLIPFFYAPSWNFVLACRALMGVGAGFFGVRSALLFQSVPAEKRDRYVGYGNVAVYTASLLAGPVCGLLTERGWQFSFLFNCIGLVTAVLVLLFLKEPEPAESGEETAAGGREAGGKISVWVYILTILQALMTGTKYPLLTGMSTLFSGRQMGSAAMAGAAISAYSVGAILGGLLLSPIKKRLGSYAMAVNMFGVSVSMLAVFAIPSAAGAFAGAFLCGMTFNLSYAFNQIHAATLAPKGKMAFCSALIFAANGAGVYISSYFIDFCQSIFRQNIDVESGILGGALCFLSMGLFVLVFRKQIEE